MLLIAFCPFASRGRVRSSVAGPSVLSLKAGTCSLVLIACRRSPTSRRRSSWLGASPGSRCSLPVVVPWSWRSSLRVVEVVAAPPSCRSRRALLLGLGRAEVGASSPAEAAARRRRGRRRRRAWPPRLGRRDLARRRPLAWTGVAMRARLRDRRRRGASALAGSAGGAGLAARARSAADGPFFADPWPRRRPARRRRGAGVRDHGAAATTSRSRPCHRFRRFMLSSLQRCPVAHRCCPTVPLALFCCLLVSFRR